MAESPLFSPLARPLPHALPMRGNPAPDSAIPPRGPLQFEPSAAGRASAVIRCTRALRDRNLRLQFGCHTCSVTVIVVLVRHRFYRYFSVTIIATHPRISLLKIMSPPILSAPLWTGRYTGSWRRKTQRRR
jgi:hypothetical protein